MGLKLFGSNLTHFLAISLGLFEIARLLLSSGANPTSKNSGGWSALHEAVSTGDPELVIEILGLGSSCDTRFGTRIHGSSFSPWISRLVYE